MHVTEDTIKLIAKGSIDAFKDLYDSLFPSLASFAMQLIKDKNEASDIVQEALLIYWRKRREFKKPDGVKAYLYKVIKNQGLNYLRSKQIHLRHYQNIKNNETFYFKDKIIEEETLSLIRNAIKDLPPQTKNIIELSMQGSANKEISELLDVSINTIKTLKLRAYQRLRDQLKDHLFVLIFLSEILL